MKYLGYILAAGILLLFLLVPDKEIKQLQEENKSLLLQVKKLDSLNDSIKVINDSLEDEVKNRKDKIITINKIKYEKLHDLDSYTVSQYQKFFSDRYPR